MKIEVDREIEFKEFRVAIIPVEGRWCHYALISLILLQFREKEREREREREREICAVQYMYVLLTTTLHIHRVKA